MAEENGALRDLKRIREQWGKLQGEGSSVYKSLGQLINDLEARLQTSEDATRIVRIPVRDNVFNTASVAASFIERACMLQRQGKEEQADKELDSAWNFMVCARTTLQSLSKQKNQ